VSRLDGKVALISGTARGMGRAAALEFAARGAMVFGCDLDEKASAETAEEVTAAGGQMAALAPVDLSGAAGARAWVQAAVARFGGVDILYNNASALRRAFTSPTRTHASARSTTSSASPAASSSTWSWKSASSTARTART
jgi:NAD(P)-dependent dehydrogenase (short-subunit alcohol dehydrogenase family)